MERKFNLNEEIICDHVVTKETKQLWNVELDLFDQLDAICKKNNIRYYAGGGTLLGAVRHQGFIPWDDDMDFFMPFEDYKRFCKLASEQLNAPYCLQYYGNTADCSPIFARVRRSDTTGCTKGEFDVIPPHNLGIYIDVFPLFYVPENKIQRRIQYFKIKLFGIANAGYKILSRKKYNKNFQPADYFNPYILAWKLLSLFMSRDKCCEKFLDACNCKKSRFIGLSSFLPGKDKYVWNASWFEDVVELPFEDRLMDCPQQYDKILSHQYGDYMKFVKGASIHTMGIVDVNTPYWQTFSERFGDTHD